ncbi:MAG TPA: FAD-dependent oxidoreductase [bacterium]|nr:FAD-dependent oxidoreductase [bacterium]
MKPVIVIGAGLAGLGAAHRLGGRAIIFEAADRVGGISQTVTYDGFSYDLGPHVLFFRSAASREFCERLLGGEWTRQPRRARITIGDERISYPIQEGFVRSPVLKRRYLPGLRRAGRTEPASPTFTEIARAQYGEVLAKEFFTDYNAKLWRYPLDGMDPEWARKFLPKFPRRGLWLVSLGFTPRRGPNAGFHYPRTGGIGSLAHRMAETVPGELRLRTVVKRVHTGERWVETGDGERHPYHALVSTLPLPRLAKIAPDLPAEMVEGAGDLPCVGTAFVHLGLKKPRPDDDSHWEYFPDPGLAFHRLHVPENYSPDMVPAGRGSVVAEVSYIHTERPDLDALTSRVIADLVKIGRIGGEDEIIARDARAFRYTYSFQTTAAERVRLALRDELVRRGVHLAGRYARWEYLHMDQSIVGGFEAADACLSG